MFYESERVTMRAYLIRLCAAAVLAALIRRAAPSNGAGRAVRLGAGLLLLLVAFGPLAKADPAAAAMKLARSGFSDPLASESFSVDTNHLLSDLISEQTKAYILDKAGKQSLIVDAEVETRVEDYYPVPWSVRIRGSPTTEQRAELSRIIAEDLGIPEERQTWPDT